MGGPWGMGYTAATLPTDEDITNMVLTNIDNDPLIPWDVNLNVRADAGEVFLEGTVPNKRIKHAAGDDAWWVPGVIDVHNMIKVAKREERKPEKR
jgi:osmotically-inducible protein OsmY